MQKKSLTNQLGFILSLLLAITTVIGSLFFIATIVIAAQAGYEWNGIESFAAFYNSGKGMFYVLASGSLFLLALIPPPIIATIHYSVPEEKRVLSLISLIFAISGMIFAIGYEFIHITYIHQGIIHENLAGLELFCIANPQSVVIPISTIGWMLLPGIANLFIAPLFSEGKLQKWIRMLFIINSVFAIISTIVYVIFSTLVLVLLYYLISPFTGTATGILLAIYFKRK
jgi:hypothetical protein